MILRRITEHVTAQNWTAVLLDFVIVVVGVFIGIQVANWNAERADRVREQQIITDMLGDLEIDRAQYANAMALSERRVHAVTTSLEGAGLPPIDFEYDLPEPDIVSYGINVPSAEHIEPSRNKRLWTDVVIGYFPTPSTSTYDAIVGSGDIKIIVDRDIVRAIQIYRNITAGVVRQNDKLTAIRAETLAIGARHGLAPYVDVGPDDYFELIASEKELAASMRILITFGIFHQGEIASADRHAAELQQRLTAYLDEAAS